LLLLLLKLLYYYDYSYSYYYYNHCYYNKMLRYQEEHSASVMLSWCTL